MKKRLAFRGVVPLLFFTFFLPIGLLAGKTVRKSGTWLSAGSPFIAQAEIDGAYVTVCLPRLEFTEPVDVPELFKRMREGIHRQDAVFFLATDGLGSPLKRGGFFFASDVYLKDLNLNYSDAMRTWGYKFKQSSKAPYDDPSYMLMVQSGGMNLPSSAAKSPGQPPDRSLGSGGSSAEVMPAGVLTPAMRKTKHELDNKIREIKCRPFKAEVLKVDAVRWATGKMGKIAPDGRISKALIEGKEVDCLIPPPKEKDWLAPDRIKELASQACEFVLQRDVRGREAQKAGAYVLADIYFTELGLTWEEWIKSRNLTPSQPPLNPDFAKAPVTLQILGIEGEWVNLIAPLLGKVKLAPSIAGPGGEEVLRLPPLEKALKDFKNVSEKLYPKIKGKPIHASIIMCPDGSPYLELGQKRVSRISFPGMKTTLAILIKEIDEKK